MLLACAIGTGGLAAQSNLFLDELLSAEEAPFGSAVYLALAAASIIPEEATIEMAVGTLAKRNWGMRLKAPTEPIRFGEYAFLLMKSFDIPGGLMYRLFPGPRYAARELVYLDLVAESSDPSRILSGEDVVRILSSVLDWSEER